MLDNSPYKYRRSRSGLYVAEAEIAKPPSPRRERGFMPAFAAPVEAPYEPQETAVVTSWWDAGGWPIGATRWVYQAKSGNGVTVANLAASYANLANPGTNNLTLGTAPTWASGTGWTFLIASSQYLKTGIVPDIDQTWSAMIQFTGAVSGLTAPLGCNNSGRYFIIQPNRGTQRGYWNAGNLFITPGVAAGNLAIGGNTGYYNGAADTGTIADASHPANTYEIYIGAFNNAGTPTYWSGNIQAVVICNKILTAPQVAAKAAQMALI